MNTSMFWVETMIARAASFDWIHLEWRVFYASPFTVEVAVLSARSAKRDPRARTTSRTKDAFAMLRSE